MMFQTLSHAGLRVQASGKELLFDPWLVGSVYWRSWWNYPPVPRALVDELRPDFIYLTHLHWDHFQADSLRLFDPSVPIIVPYDRYERMTRDLRAVGRHNIIELKHGQRLQLAEGLALRSYHFAPFVTDSAAIVEADDHILFNANDAKLAGGPLNQVLRDYPKIDFCFRSHSSANARACYHYADDAEAEVDDNDHYIEAFSLFMTRVKPRFAIPFASNSCLLHDDTYAMNPLVQTPLKVAEKFAKFREERGLDTRLQVMIPGDSWSPDNGFVLQEHDYFTNREQRLAEYRERVRPTLERQAALEDKVVVSLSTMRKFFEPLSRKVPWFLSRKLTGHEILIVSRSKRGVSGFALDLAAGKVREVPESDFGSFDARIEFPALVLLQSLRLNMFGHAAISKRVHYYATREAMPRVSRLSFILECEEAELLPISRNLSARSLKAVLPRWREGLLYLRTLFELARGNDLPTTERKFLSA